MYISYIGGELMKNYYKIILSLTILSLISVGWGQVLYESFENSYIDESWIIPDLNQYEVNLNNSGADGTVQSLSVQSTGYNQNHSSAIYREFDASTPSYVRVFIDYSTSRLILSNYFKLGHSNIVDSWGGMLNMKVYSNAGLVIQNGGEFNNLHYPLIEGWNEIEFKNINYFSHTFDFYLNGTMMNTYPFYSNISNITHIGMHNWTDEDVTSTGFYDEIYIGDEPLDGAGCTDPYACNYDEDASEDDGSCEYEVDCAGECGGDAVVDECGVCGGDGSACDDSNIMNVITGLVASWNGDGGYQEGIGAGFYVFNDPITEDINMSLNGEILSKQRTYHYSGPMGGYTFETDDEFEYADSVNLNVSGDFNFDYTVFMPTNMMITSHNEGDAIEPLQDLIITYTASNYDFFYFSYYIDDYEGVGHSYSGFTYDTSFTIQSELLENAYWININVYAINGKHPIDEIMDYNENTMANIFGSNETWLSLGVDGREESQQGTHHSIIDLWESGEFSRLYSQFITESEDNSDYQLMDITSDDIFIYSVIQVYPDYYGYDENIIYPFIIISSPIYFEDTQIFVNEVEIEANYILPFGLTTVFNDGGEFAEYPTSQDINTYEIHINGEVISGEFTFSDSTEFTNWTSGQSYDGAEDLYIEWVDNEADFYSIRIDAWDWTGNQSCSLDTAFITEDSNFTIANTFFTNCLSDGSEIEVRVASVNGVLPVAGTSGDFENSYGFSWAWNNDIYLNIPYNSEGSFDGCTDPSACNYDETATQDDGNCEYPDCAGECGGDAVIDECGECNGSGIPDGECDCDGNVLDECGVCGGDGAVFGDTGCCEIDVDECGLCGGENVCTDVVGDWMVHYGGFWYGDEICYEEGMEVFSIYEDGTFYEAPCGGGTWTQAGDIITLYMPYCELEWTGTLEGDTIVDGTYGTGDCWNAERLLTSTTYINDLTYTGEPIEDPVEMTFTPIIEEDRDCFVVGPDADCAGVCFGDAVVDECDECGGNGVNSNDYGDCECQIVGDVWADCAGQCGGDAEVDCAGQCGGDAEVDCAGQCGGDAVYDDCNICDDDPTNDNSTCEILAHLSITNVDTDAGTLDIYMINEVEVGGFQFQLFGSINISNLSGGSAAEYYDWVSFAYIEEGDYHNLLGFSVALTTIPAGEGLLTQISFSDYQGGEICFGEDPSLNLIGTGGIEILSSWGDCYTPPECDVALGDVNGDGDISILDLVQISYYILELSIPNYECAADYNQDGSVDILDLVAIVNIILFDE